MYDTVIIVLGNKNSAIMEKRVDKAIEYFYSLYYPCETVQNKWLLFSGYNESNEMYNYALSKGIDEKYLITENKSTDTVENMEMCYELLQKKFPKTDYRMPNIVVCTSSFHINRSFVIAMKVFKQNITMIHTDEDISDEQHDHELHELERVLKLWTSI